MSRNSRCKTQTAAPASAGEAVSVVRAVKKQRQEEIETYGHQETGRQITQISSKQCVQLDSSFNKYKVPRPHAKSLAPKLLSEVETVKSNCK